jgi:hypothetical protein
MPLKNENQSQFITVFSRGELAMIKKKQEIKNVQRGRRANTQVLSGTSITLTAEQKAWLTQQPNGITETIRQLVDEAMARANRTIEIGQHITRIKSLKDQKVNYITAHMGDFQSSDPKVVENARLQMANLDEEIKLEERNMQELKDKIDKKLKTIEKEMFETPSERELRISKQREEDKIWEPYIAQEEKREQQIFNYYEDRQRQYDEEHGIIRCPTCKGRTNDTGLDKSGKDVPKCKCSRS